jgi:hypothetical protein
MEEAMAESRRIAAKGIIPPKFIPQATIKQMEDLPTVRPAKIHWWRCLPENAGHCIHA